MQSESMLLIHHQDIIPVVGGVSGKVLPIRSLEELVAQGGSHFFRSKSPGLVFSATYQRGIATPSAFSTSSSCGFPH